MEESTQQGVMGGKIKGEKLTPGIQTKILEMLVGSNLYGQALNLSQIAYLLFGKSGKMMDRLSQQLLQKFIP